VPTEEASGEKELKGGIYSLNPWLIKTQLFQQPQARLILITVPLLREAARLRATIPSLRTPDAIHAATAPLVGCPLFATNDPGFRRVPGLPVVVLQDLATP
jgi:predicted nucleic acid-binding protein